MDKSFVFDAPLRAVDGVDGAYVEFPYDVNTEFGTQGRVKVIATFDGVEYRGILVKMKTPCHIIGVRKAIRERIGKQAGDVVSVTIRADRENRVAEPPASLQSALEQNKEAAGFFETLTASQKNKFISFVASAKRQDTADQRRRKVVEMLERKEKMK